MGEFHRRERFCGRVIRFTGVVMLRGTRFKRYDITARGVPVDEASYGRGAVAAEELLPREAVGPERPGVGVMIRHTGAGMEYLVVCWWDNQNELITRVLVRGEGAGGGEWRDGAGSYSFCVWDMEVMWHERNAYVRHVMSPESAPDIEAYLRDPFTGPSQ